MSLDLSRAEIHVTDDVIHIQYPSGKIDSMSMDQFKNVCVVDLKLGFGPSNLSIEQWKEVLDRWSMYTTTLTLHLGLYPNPSNVIHVIGSIDFSRVRTLNIYGSGSLQFKRKLLTRIFQSIHPHHVTTLRLEGLRPGELSDIVKLPNLHRLYLLNLSGDHSEAIREKFIDPNLRSLQKVYIRHGPHTAPFRVYVPNTEIIIECLNLNEYESIDFPVEIRTDSDLETCRAFMKRVRGVPVRVNMTGRVPSGVKYVIHPTTQTLPSHALYYMNGKKAIQLTDGE